MPGIGTAAVDEFEVCDVVAIDEGFTFRFGRVRLRYDRLGLDIEGSAE